MNDLGPPPDPRDIERLREAPPIDPGAKGRVRARLGAVVPSFGTSAPGSAPAEAAPRIARAAWTATHGVALGAFLAGGLVGAALYARLVEHPAPRIVLVDRPVSEPTGGTAPSPLPAAPVAAPSPPVDVAAPSTSGPRSAPSQLSAERRILDEARAAMLRGEAQQALDALERHRRTFHSPLLGEERDALQVQALVKAGRYPEARARGDAFRRRLPDSFYLPMVDSALASIP